MTATILEHPSRYKAEIEALHTDISALREDYKNLEKWRAYLHDGQDELREHMDDMRKLLDQPHATDEYDQPLNKRGLFHVLWILACWNLLNTIVIAIRLVG